MPSIIERAENTFYPLVKDLAGRNIREDQVLLYPGDMPFEAQDALYCIGTFDGVHKGHQKLIAEAKTYALERGLPLIAATFNPRPQDVLAPGAQSYITSRSASIHYLLQAGADAVLAQTFTKELSKLPFNHFLDNLLNSSISMQALCVGKNLRMGHKAHAGIEEMAAYARTNGLPFYTSDLLDIGGQAVSSSRTRLAITAGELSSTYDFLGRDFFVAGEVIHGKGEGKSFGFATANLAIPDDSALVPEGVYAGYALVGKSMYPAAINVGFPKSFPEQEIERKHFLEAHLLGFNEDIYGEVISVAPVASLRQPKAFKSLEELKLCVEENIHQTEELIGPGLIAELM